MITIKFVFEITGVRIYANIFFWQNVKIVVMQILNKLKMRGKEEPNFVLFFPLFASVWI